MRTVHGAHEFAPTATGIKAILLSFFAGLLVLSTTAHPAALQTHVEPASLALGEPITLTLSGQQLESIDLAPLAVDFHIDSRTQSHSNTGDSLSLTLYPLHTGRLVVPALLAGVARGKALAVTVTTSSAMTPRVVFRVETEPTATIQRQPTRLTLEACDDASLDWRRPLLPHDAALYTRPLGEDQSVQMRDGERCTAHRWHWLLIATRDGAIRLNLAMLEASKFGKQLRFPAPAIAFQVAAVPAWLPPEVAIGRPRVSAVPLPATWPLERPLARSFEVVGGYSVAGLKSLLALQAGNSPGVKRYDTTVESLPAEARNSPLPRLRVTQYIEPLETGPLRLPTLNLPWYDPASGRLEKLAVAGGRLEIVNPATASFVRAAAGLLGAALLAGLGVWALRRLAWRRHKRRSLARLAASTDLTSLARACRAYSLRADAQPAASLGLWRERQLEQTNCEELEVLVASLQRARYGGAGGDFERTRDQALRVLRRCRPRA